MPSELPTAQLACVGVRFLPALPVGRHEPGHASRPLPVDPRPSGCYLGTAMGENIGKNDRWDDIWAEKRKTASGRVTSAFAKDIVYRTVDYILRREVPDPCGKRILEVGSGTGLVSLALARRGAKVTLCDISPAALEFSRTAFARAGSEGETVQGSILDLPFEDGAFDVTWNAGVIEHFEGAEQLRALREMLRVTKPDGRIVVAVPWSGARIYLRAKKFADSRGAWQPGYEAPIASFKEIAPRIPATIVTEYSTGFLAQLHFMKYYFARPRWLKLAWVGLVEAMSLPLFLANRRPGYLLVAVMKRQ
ncbi:MAG: methyltransferase domain-containing protein [bacterium]